MKYFIIFPITFILFCNSPNRSQRLSDVYREIIYKNYSIENNDDFLKARSKELKVDNILLCDNKLVSNKIVDELNLKSQKVFDRCIKENKCFFLKVLKKVSEKERLYSSTFIKIVWRDYLKTSEISEYNFYPPISCRIECMSVIIDEIESYIYNNLPNCKVLEIIISLMNRYGNNMKTEDNTIFNPNGIIFTPEIINNNNRK